MGVFVDVYVFYWVFVFFVEYFICFIIDDIIFEIWNRGNDFDIFYDVFVDGRMVGVFDFFDVGGYVDEVSVWIVGDFEFF